MVTHDVTLESFIHNMIKYHTYLMRIPTHILILKFFKLPTDFCEGFGGDGPADIIQTRYLMNVI